MLCFPIRLNIYPFQCHEGSNYFVEHVNNYFPAYSKKVYLTYCAWKIYQIRIFYVLWTSKEMVLCFIFFVLHFCSISLSRCESSELGFEFQHLACYFAFPTPQLLITLSLLVAVAVVSGSRCGWIAYYLLDKFIMTDVIWATYKW